MNTPTQPTEAHYTLRRDVIFSAPDEGAQLIADSEARAVRDALTEDYKESKAIEDARNELRAELARLDSEKPWLKEANATVVGLRAEVERLRDIGCVETLMRAERAEAELATERARGVAYEYFARTLERELYRERAKVRTLREALIRRHDEQSYYRAYVDAALAATEDAR